MLHPASTRPSGGYRLAPLVLPPLPPTSGFGDTGKGTGRGGSGWMATREPTSPLPGPAPDIPWVEPPPPDDGTRCPPRPPWPSPPHRNRRWSGGSRRQRCRTPVRRRAERRQLRPTRPRRRAAGRPPSRSQPRDRSGRLDQSRLTGSHRSGLSRLTVPSRWPRARPSRSPPEPRHLLARPVRARSRRRQSRALLRAPCSRTPSSSHLALPGLPTRDVRRSRGTLSPLPRTFARPVRRPRRHPDLPAGPSRWTSSSRGSTPRRRPGPTCRAIWKRRPSRPTRRGSA